MPMNALGQPIGAPVTNTAPRPRPARTAMVGHYCNLVPLRVDHCADLFTAFAADTEGRIWTYLADGPFPTQADYLPWVTAKAASEDPLFFAIEVDGVAVGHASYLRIDPAGGAVEVGWINLSPALQRTRAATEFQFLMMARVFDDLGYRRYEWKCDDLNLPSRAAAARLGFTYEGTFRQATHYKGRNRDTAWFSIIDTEWPAIRAEFQRWLDPSNFDQNGQQRSRLEMPKS